ncbi:MAG: indole-3-glycerol phosphate synthase TrpC [Gemmataceae bacterium]|nr:indole-3-glycerol phosphate synthase TrpC [Gemmataceae bacterium]
MSDFLEKIISTKIEEVELAYREHSLETWQALAKQGPPIKSIWKIIASQKGMGVIAEIKKASPSAGVIQFQFDPINQAKSYIQGDATAISVLTDKKWFQGDISYLESVAKLDGPPVLRKDFIIDKVQIYEARAAGADLVLLIADVLSDEPLMDFVSLIHQLGMEALVELHDESHLDRVLKTGATLIGVNNRNLRTFKVDMNTTLRIKAKAPSDITIVGESGIQTRQDVQTLWDAGVQMVLVGESLMRSGNPVETLRDFRNVGT